MDIVIGWFAFDAFKRLSSHHSQNMGMVLAATLIDGHGLLGNVKRPVSQTFLHVHEDVGQLAAVRYHGLGGVCAPSGPILAHVNFPPLVTPARNPHPPPHPPPTPPLALLHTPP